MVSKDIVSGKKMSMKYQDEKSIAINLPGSATIGSSLMRISHASQHLLGIACVKLSGST